LIKNNPEINPFSQTYLAKISSFFLLLGGLTMATEFTEMWYLNHFRGLCFCFPRKSGGIPDGIKKTTSAILIRRIESNIMR
jgi:hypothetical protein